MKNFSLLLLLICAIGHAQIEETIKKDITKLANIINTKDVQGFYDFLCDTKDLKKLFAASDETDYNKIKFRYGQHLEMQPNMLFHDELDRKLKKYKKRPKLKPHLVLYKKATMEAEKKTVITIFFKDANGSLFSMELKSKKIGNEMFYAYKGELEKLQQKNIDNFNQKIKPLITNNTSSFSIISFSKASSTTKEKAYPYATLDEKPIIENKVQLSDFSKKVQTEVLKIIDPSKENLGRNRCMVRLIVTKDKQFKNIRIRAATKTLEDNVLTILQKQKVTQAGKKDGIPVDTEITLVLMFTIK
ncbi:MAG: hypothetical protein AB8B65_03340 [Kordia sp.]|uniref:hypothetical protein n=1 Tax=Kordia sp. TaxID=1965332 RepID=UPI0038585A9E